MIIKKTKIAILYICTGQYTIFWQDFYNSFQEKFLLNCQKEYFVFTDEENLCTEKNVHLIYINHLEWPYNTLFRFEFFLKIKDELEKYDYIYFFNSNMKCNKIISEQEFLPNVSKGEKLVVAIHPLYRKTKSRHCPFERDKKSLAYVPYSDKTRYIMGSLNGGEKQAYLLLCIKLASNIRKDFQRGIIAKFHDESHLNAYIARQSAYEVKYLSPSYIYPVDLRPDYPANILLLDKRIFFDVDKFKNNRKKKLVIRVVNKIKRYIYEDINYLHSLLK